MIKEIIVANPKNSMIGAVALIVVIIVAAYILWPSSDSESTKFLKEQIEAKDKVIQAYEAQIEAEKEIKADIIEERDIAITEKNEAIASTRDIETERNVIHANRAKQKATRTPVPDSQLQSATVDAISRARAVQPRE